MTVSIIHSTYGEIVFTENILTGKRTLTVNNNSAIRVSNKEFYVGSKRARILGNLYTGIDLRIENETVVLVPKPKWYELILALIPVILHLTWGNSAEHCAIFPIIGGAIGGALGALFTFFSLIAMKKSKKPATKVLIGVGVICLALAVSFAVASLMILLL